METTIYYFTGTGNSLKIAMSLSEKLEQCELVPIAKIWEDDHLASSSEKVGFIFPLYYAGLPKIVYDFLSKIELAKSNYFFAVITNAGDINNTPLLQIETILNTKSKSLSAGFYVKMPNNYIIGKKSLKNEELRARNLIMTFEIVFMSLTNLFTLKTHVLFAEYVQTYAQ